MRSSGSVLDSRSSSYPSENQRGISAALAQKELVVYLGTAETTTVDDLRAAVQALMVSSARQSLSQLGVSVVYGFGTQRVAQRMARPTSLMP